MKRYRWLWISLGIFSLLGCEEVPEFELGDTTPVVEAFIYANEPVDNIIIKEVQPFETESGVEDYLIALSPIIRWQGEDFPLVETDTLPGRYYYPGTDLSINMGDSYQLLFDFEGKLVSGTTIVPQAPTGMNITVDEIMLPQIEELRDAITFFQNNEIEQLVEWDNPSGEYFYLVIENVEENPESLDPGEVLPFNFEFTSEPTQENFFTILPFVHYSQFGLHQVILYRVNEEYALLFESLEQDSRDLNEPFSNITNGVGVFSAFASDTVYFEIVKQE